jgi:two-component sensor histidine kinase
MPAAQHIHAFGLFLADGVTRPTPAQMPLYRATRFGETVSNEEWVIERPGDQLADPAARALFKETEHRIKSMALIHEALYQASDLARIDFSRYVEALGQDLLGAYAGDPRHVRLELEPVFLDIERAIPCGLILNEILPNALRHAFPDGRSGEITVALRQEVERIVLCVRDTGVGVPADLDLRQTDSLGLQPVGILTEQLGGRSPSPARGAPPSR